VKAWTGIWDGKMLHVGRNFTSARVLANGPIRAIFELTYDTWAAGGIFVSETKRFTVDAGHHLDRIESTFAASGNTRELTVGIGLNKNPADAGQSPLVEVIRGEAEGLLAQWIEQQSNGDLGTAILVPSADFAGHAGDDRNLLVLAKVVPGKPLTYLAGAAWSRVGEFTTKQAWSDHLASLVARARAPIKVSLSQSTKNP